MHKDGYAQGRFASKTGVGLAFGCIERAFGGVLSVCSDARAAPAIGRHCGGQVRSGRIHLLSTFEARRAV